MKSTGRKPSVLLLLLLLLLWLLLAILQHRYCYERMNRWQMPFSEGTGKITCLVARSEANDYVLNETAIQHADQEKTFGSHCGKNMETISPVQKSRKSKSKRGFVLFLHDALVGCLICKFFFSFLVLWLRSRWSPKVKVLFSYARCPRTQKKSPCSKAFRVEISKMPREALMGVPHCPRVQRALSTSQSQRRWAPAKRLKSALPGPELTPTRSHTDPLSWGKMLHFWAKPVERGRWSSSMRASSGESRTRGWSQKGKR